MKIAVAGIGGIGGILGGALAKSGADAYFYVRGENLKAIRNGGLKVDSITLGSFTARPKAASDNAEELGAMDAVFVCCKGYALEAMCRGIAPMIESDTIVVPLLNGVEISGFMRPILPNCILADGIIWVFSHIEEPGHVVQNYGKCKIIFGMSDGSRPEKLGELASALDDAGIDTQISDDIALDSWKKYLSMCGNSVVLCYYGGNVGEVRGHEGYKKVLRSVAEEIVTVARAKGSEMPVEYVDKFVEGFSKLAPETINSLYRDLTSGKPADKTELRHIIGRMVEFGRQTGVPTPYHEAVYKRFAK